MQLLATGLQISTSPAAQQGPRGSFVQPKAQLTLFTTHKGSNIHENIQYFVFKKPGLPFSLDTLLLCELRKTVITKPTSFILSPLTSGSRQAPLPTPTKSATKIL